MKSFYVRFAFVMIVSLITGPLLAQSVPARGMGGWGPGKSYTRMFDPKSIATVTGEVVLIEQFTPPNGMSVGVHAIVKTGTESLSVHLGPAWFIENQEPQIAPGDKIEVKGSRITFGGKPALIAAEVRKGDDVLVLRDASGLPTWSGWKRRR